MSYPSFVFDREDYPVCGDLVLMNGALFPWVGTSAPDKHRIYRAVAATAPLKRVVFEPTCKRVRCGEWYRPDYGGAYLLCSAETVNLPGYVMREEDVPPRDGADLLAGEIATECFHGFAYDGDKLVEIIRRHHAAYCNGGTK